MTRCNSSHRTSLCRRTRTVPRRDDLLSVLTPVHSNFSVTENGLAARVKLSGVSRFFFDRRSSSSDRPEVSHLRACMLVGMGSLGTGTVVQNLVDAIDVLVDADVNSLADAESIKVARTGALPLRSDRDQGRGSFRRVRGLGQRRCQGSGTVGRHRLPAAAGRRPSPSPQGKDDASSPGSNRRLGTRPAVLRPSRPGRLCPARGHQRGALS